MQFGDFIKKQRLFAHYSANQLSTFVGCSTSFITGIERGAQHPSTITARKILDCLDVEYVELNSLELQITNGPKFKFKSSLRGRNREPENNFGRAALVERIRLLENRVSSLEGVILSIMANKE